jgi:hypothetical protein
MIATDVPAVESEAVAQVTPAAISEAETVFASEAA